MKKIILTSALALVLAFGAGSGNAQMMGGGQHMMGGGGGRQANMAGQKPCMMMGGSGMGMMGNGMGMMGGNMMMGRGMGMMGGGMMGMGMQNPAQYNKFMDETKGLRRKLHDMRFDYGEAMRNPKTTMGDLQKMQEEMGRLQQQIMQKMPAPRQQGGKQ